MTAASRVALRAAVAALALLVTACSGAAGTGAAPPAAGTSPTGTSPTGTSPTGTSPTSTNRAAAAAQPDRPPLPAGWPAPASDYLGRYRLTASTDPAFATSGLLTLFVRQVERPTPMRLPSGVLSAHGRDATTVLYLTLRHAGSRAVAELSAGNFGYPAVGRAQLLTLDTRRHALALAVTAGDSPPITLHFVRYSADPHP